MRQRARTLGVLWILAVVAAASPARADAPDHAAVRASLYAADSLISASIGVLGPDGIGRWLARDATYLHPDQPVITGREAARGVLRTAFAAQRLHRLGGDASADGTLGYTFGWFDDGARYIATWRNTTGLWWVAGFVRIPGRKPPSPPPADAAILAGDHGTPHPSTAEQTAHDATTADAMFSQRSESQGYTAAFTHYGAADAVIVGGSDLYWNAAGVAQALGGWTSAEQLRWRPQISVGAASGDLAFTIGVATMTVRKGTQIDRHHSKYLTVWARQPDGSWRFLADGGNAAPAGVD